MFVTEGARALALEQERKQFVEVEWPLILKRMEDLGLEPESLTHSDHLGDRS